jgi:hypothetical protein
MPQLVISTVYDAVVTPYTSQALRDPGAHNVILQRLCLIDFSGHIAITYDPIALHEVLNALDPAKATPTNCLSHL